MSDIQFNAAQYAPYEIGTQYDEHGEPLVVVDGKIFGTVAEVKDLIRRFEDQESTGLSKTPVVSSIIVGDDSPVTRADVREMIREYDKNRERRRRAGANA